MSNPAPPESRQAKLVDDAQPLPSPSKRLALFFDGTWNKPQNNTNVWRLSLMLAGHGADGLPQKSFYNEGVGTYWFDRLSGGAFGAGLSHNVRSGYRWLMEHYDPGDEIYLFGFSRGAFTARSLAGLIARCGLLTPDAPMSFWDLYERYRQGDAVRPIYKLKYLQKHDPTATFDFQEKVLLNQSSYHRKIIKMVGVWDTVGSLGVPFGRIKGISSRTLSFHNTHLSQVVEHSYQVLCFDEQRRPYWAMLWTNFVPNQPDASDASYHDDRMIEQRWFAGAHANVGGSYQQDLLPQRPVAWLQKKAIDCGLRFRKEITLNNDDFECKPRDSYAEFLCGLWKIITLGRRYVRWVQSDPKEKESGWVETVNERIDESVFHRCQRDQTYRPLSLKEWSLRKGLDLEAVIDAPERYLELSRPRTTPGIESSIPRKTVVK